MFEQYLPDIGIESTHTYPTMEQVFLENHRHKSEDKLPQYRVGCFCTRLTSTSGQLQHKVEAKRELENNGKHILSAAEYRAETFNLM